MVIDEGSLYVMNVWFIGYVIVYMNGMLGLGLCIVQWFINGMLMMGLYMKLMYNLLVM